MGLQADREDRQTEILKMVSAPGGASSKKMADKLHTTTGQIVQEVRALRKRGYPIQTSTMVTEGGMYVAAFELPKKHRARS